MATSAMMDRADQALNHLKRLADAAERANQLEAIGLRADIRFRLAETLDAKVTVQEAAVTHEAARDALAALDELWPGT